LTMLPSALFLFSLVTLARGDCGFPNGTDSSLHWWQSPGPTTFAAATTVLDVRAVDSSNNDVYPLRLPDSIALRVTITNGETQSWNGVNFRLSLKVSQYGSLDGCNWTDVSAFASLEDTPACENGAPCPFPLGDSQITVRTDLSSFQPVINLLKNDSPYQFVYTFSNTSSSRSFAFTLQARALTK
ncbi:hypothetical protein PENTCL1PPCAC_11349, partial [Pristionchus entomophagus]